MCKGVYFFLLCFLFFPFTPVSSQFCNQLGQTPATAFPVCGTTTFSQSTVPICSNAIVPVPCPASAVIYYDRNPFWYKFTCFSPGTLGFRITPVTLSDDYDWQLFDITGRDPNDIFTDPSLFVACNWSGEGGVTGASNAGTSLIVCEGLGKPLFSTMPTLITGHNYLLLVSHFTVSQSGYSLQFTGGTAGITDPNAPALQGASANCDGTRITIKLNKKVKCNSLTPSGSDFKLSTAAATILSATGSGCSNSFDVDSVILTLSNPLPQGTYSVFSETGSDGNTLIDNCDREVLAATSVPFTVTALQPTQMDSLAAVRCNPFSLQLVFRSPIRCSSIAADGSDFVLSGTAPFSITNASGVCTNGLTSVINLQLNNPIQSTGSFQVKLARGTDGNTIIDECGTETPPGGILNFTTKDTVSALFNYTAKYGCRFDTLSFLNAGGNGINAWKWNFGTGSSTQQNPQGIKFVATGQYPVSLIVSNGFCTDTVLTTIALNNEARADFSVADQVCSGDLVTIQNNSRGSIDTWRWDFGNLATSSTQQNPPSFLYTNTGQNTVFNILLTVTNNNAGCIDTAIRQVKGLGNCTVVVPTGFTPNGDGLNDYLYPLNTLKAINLDFKVFNRWGQLVFHSTDGTKKWDGKINDKPQNTGSFVWMLSYTHKDTGVSYFSKGTTTLIR